MRTTSCLLIFLALGGAAAAQEPSTGPEPILETGELMAMVIKPAYDELQRAMAAPPADRQQWAQLYAAEANFDGIKKAFEDVSGRCNACHRAMSREAPTIRPE